MTGRRRFCLCVRGLSHGAKTSLHLLYHYVTITVGNAFPVFTRYEYKSVLRS